jgi:type II secretory ATPase GspE/PulE/Tfp pilus assembly ATPase PilB-like protein
MAMQEVVPMGNPTEAVSPEFWLRHRAVPLAEGLVACADPTDEALRSLVRFRAGRELHPQPWSVGELEPHLVALRDQVEGERLLGELESHKELMQRSEAAESAPVIRLVANVINGAIHSGATDIHVEHEADSLQVRLRVDGLLRAARSLPAWVAPALVSRLKILASLDIGERRRPQDGRISWAGAEGVDIRVSTLPTRHGEKVVLRLLRAGVGEAALGDLGLAPHHLERLRRLVELPQGMILVTGPTGSGKSTTLYAALRAIADRPINIVTVEDPVEHQLPRANQVQVNEKAGLTFASALRSILRQDPDVILVGEIRDAETASIAMQAAQTGHLVLSTLHTNDAVGAVTRLVDLGVPRFLIGSSLLAVVAQRLVRTLCPRCKVLRAPTALERTGLPQLPAQVWAAHPGGCHECAGTGYKGRQATFEMLDVVPELGVLIRNGADESLLRSGVVMAPLLDDALAKAAAGLTSPEELLRVIVRG